MEGEWLSGRWSYCRGRTRWTGNQSAETIQSTFPPPTPGQGNSLRVGELPKPTAFCVLDVSGGGLSSPTTKYIKCGVSWPRLSQEDTEEVTDVTTSDVTRHFSHRQLLPPEQTSQFVTR